jgi:hypothetical protein
MISRSGTWITTNGDRKPAQTETGDILIRFKPRMHTEGNVK